MKESTKRSWVCPSDEYLRPGANAFDWTRAVVYATGGLLAMLMLWSLSHHDGSGTRGTPSAGEPFSAWNGSFSGTLQSTTAAGDVVAQSHVTRTFRVEQQDRAVLEFRESVAAGSPLVFLGTQVQKSGVVTRTLIRDGAQEVIEGRIDSEGIISWRRDTERDLTFLREWIVGETLYVEGFSLRKGIPDSTLYHAGRLRRPKDGVEPTP
ncbi:MAG: hypothetical protein SF028_11045 [Candidatus Sumerlaeia bacterium]|nr:hypothetical protein [Candidatus Sumerlaeia bacterium]